MSKVDELQTPMTPRPGVDAFENQSQVQRFTVLCYLQALLACSTPPQKCHTPASPDHVIPQRHQRHNDDTTYPGLDKTWQLEKRALSSSRRHDYHHKASRRGR